MTPEEAAANSSAIMGALTSLGVTPEQALYAEGLQAARARLERAYQATADRGDERGLDRLDARMEREAQAHARRGMAQYARVAGRQVPERGDFRPNPAGPGHPLTLPPAWPQGNPAADAVGGALDLGEHGVRRVSQSMANAAMGVPRLASLATGTQGQGFAGLGDQVLSPWLNQPEPTSLGGRIGALAGDTAGAFLTAPPAAAVNALARPVVAAGQAIGRTVRAHPVPAVAGVAALGGVPAASRGDPPQPPEPQNIRDARRTVDTIRTEQNRLNEELAELRTQYDRFDPTKLAGASEDDIKKVQLELKRLKLYQKRIDGNWGGATTDAAAVHRGNIERRQADARSRLDALDTRFSTENETLNGILRDERVNRVRAEVSPFEQFVREYGPIAAGVIGGGAGAAWRLGTRAGVNSNRQVQVDAANRLLAAGAPDDVARVANVNAFYQRGGGRPQFSVDRNERMGFAPRPDQAPDATALYPPGRPHYQGVDAARMLGFAGITGLGEERYRDASRRAEALLEEERQNPTESIVRDRQRAERERAIFDATRKFGAGAFVSYPVAARVMPYRTTRPDTQLAEAEVMRLNQLHAQNRNQNLPQWRAPQVTEFGPFRQGTDGRYHRPNGHFASADEIAEWEMLRREYQRGRNRP